MEDSSPSATAAPAESAPVPVIQTEGLDVLTRKLVEGKTPAEATAILEIRKAKGTKPSAKVAKATAAPEPTASTAEEPTSTEHVLDFAAEPEPTPTPAPETTEPAPLTESELALLSEKARKQYLDASKEAAKVRKRAQDAEAKLATEQAAAAQAAEEIARLKGELETRTTSGALSFNVYGEIPATQEGATTVAAWAKNSQEAMKKLQLRAMGKEDIDLLTHKFPDGEERELTADDVDLLQQRIDDANAWRSFQTEASASRQRSASLLSRLDSTPGYKEAYAALSRSNVQTQLPELLAKAALYDTLVAGKGRIIFPGEAAAATNAALSTPRMESQTRNSAATPPSPPRETTGTAPRMVPEDSDHGTERSALKQRAMKSGSPADIKAAILAVGKSKRSA